MKSMNNTDNVHQSEQSELMFHEYLHSLGLHIQTRLHVLICTGCETVLLPKSVLRHFSEHHCSSQVKINEETILNIATQLNLLEEMPNIQSPVLYYQGLTLFQDCFKCLHCPKVFGKKTLPVHYSTDHPRQSRPKFDQLPPIYAQKLNNGQHKSLFEVFVPWAASVPTSTNKMIEQLRLSRDNLIPQYFPHTVDSRSLSPWMRYTGWHSYVAPYPTSWLIALVAMPQKDEPRLQKIKAAVASIFDSAYNYIDKTNLIVLQRLKTDDIKGMYVLFIKLMNNSGILTNIIEFRINPFRNCRRTVQDNIMNL